MKLKPKGRKIYRYKTRFERAKGFFRNTGAVIMTIAGVAVLVFVGYSVGGPVMKFLEEKKLIIPAGEASSAASTEQLPTETAAFSGTDPLPAESEPESITETQAPEPSAQQMQGYYLETAALLSENTLQAAIASVPDGVTHVVVPLKAAGGKLYYTSALPDAETCGAVAGTMPLETIYSTISALGYIPAASINALEDSIYPQAFKEAGYQIAGTQERWLDASPEDGGRPRMSPFSSAAAQYLADITGEVAAAGFSLIFCEGLTFPDFSEDDLLMLDPRAGAPDRGSALVVTANAMQEAAGNAQFYIRLDGADIISGGAEIHKSGKPLNTDGYLVALNDTTRGKTSVVEAMMQDYNYVILLEGGNTADAGSLECGYILQPVVQEFDAPVPETSESTGVSETAVSE